MVSTAEQRQNVFKRFSVEDEAKGVHIPPSLAINALHKLGYHPSKTQLNKELAIRGPLTMARFEDVCEAQESTQVERNTLVDALRVFDRSNLGRLEKSIVEDFLTRGDDGLSREELNYAMIFAQEDSFIMDENDAEEDAENGGVDANKENEVARTAGGKKKPVTYINIESFATVLLEGRQNSSSSGSAVFGTKPAEEDEEEEAATEAGMGNQGADLDKGGEQADENQNDAAAAEETETKDKEVTAEEEEHPADQNEESQKPRNMEKPAAEKTTTSTTSEEPCESKSRGTEPEKQPEEKKKEGGCCVVM